MPLKKIPHVTLVDLEFDSLLGKTAQEIYRHFRLCQRLSRKKFFGKSVDWDGYRVTESKERITIHLAQNGKVTAYFSFVPAPRFEMG